MNIVFMRYVDIYIGTPICFVLGIINSIINGIKNISKRLFQIKTRLSLPKNIMVIQISEMGSIFLGYSALKKTKQLFPKSELYFLTFKNNKECVELTGQIKKSNILTIRKNNLLVFTFDVIKVIFQMRRLRIDAVIDFELFARFSSILSYLSGARYRVGYYGYKLEGLYRGSYLTHKVTYNPHQHIGINFLSLVYSLDSSPDDMPMLKKAIERDELSIPMIGSANEDKKALWKKLEKLNTKIEKNDIIIIINPDGGELPLREWPLENYIMLAKELLKDSRIFIIITGLKTARKHADAIIRSVKNDRIIDLTDKTTLKDLFTLYNISHIHVTCDSGPAHFASLTQIKNIIFFGPETPHLYSPLGENNIIFYSNYACSPCITAYNHRNSACKDSKCLKAISYEQVYKIISKEIEKIKKSKDNNA